MNRLLGKGNPKEPTPNTSDCIAKVENKVELIESKIQFLENELRKFREQMNKMREGPAKKSVKAKALRILKQKRYYENQLDNLRGQSFNMEQATFALQSLKDTKVTISVMKGGLKEMKREFKKVNLDDVDVSNINNSNFFNHLNSIHNTIKFTIEKETNGALYIWNVLVQRNDKEAINKVYHIVDSVKTGIVIHYDKNVQDELADLLDQSDEIQEALGRSYNTPELDDDELDAELDALGDEIAEDNDQSYLDDVLNAPAVPTGSRLESLREENKDGIHLDDFGLPQIPSHSHSSVTKI